MGAVASELPGPSISARPARGGLTALRALWGRAMADSRTRTVCFAALLLIYAYIQPVGYRHAYPTVAQRLSFARSFAGNDALRLFYGYPYAIVSVGGYTAWRVGGTAAILTAAFGLLAAVRALRTEEDGGRAELVLAGAVSRWGAYLAAVAAILAQTAVLWAAELCGLLAGGLPAGQSVLLAAATASMVPVFAGVGALASQLAGTRRGALELGAGAIVVSLLVRVVADTSAGTGWLRWLTPLGWAEEVRPFAGSRPAVLLAPLAAAAILLALAGALQARRDVGTGILPARDRARPRLRLLGSPTALALRGERGSLATWGLGVGGFAFVLGLVSASVSSAGISAGLRRELAKLGGASIATPRGYLSFVFVFFVLAISLFCCAQVGAARQEEADERLETLLALPVGRRSWLGGRLLLGVGGAVALALLAGLGGWAGAAAQGVSVSLPDMLGAGANCLPAALLFGGAGALAYALLPRAASAIAYGLLAVSFLWYLAGSVLGVPGWLVEATPFAHVGLVPDRPFQGVSAAAMLATGLACALLALAAFRRRDLTGN